MELSSLIRKLLPGAFTLALFLAGCGLSKEAATATAVASSAATSTIFLSPPSEQETAIPSSTASLIPASPGAAPAPPTYQATTTPAPTPTVTPEPHPLAPYTIAGMRAREYPGGEIRILDLLEENESFSRYFIAYPSDGLKITGTMNAPLGKGPFPVVILLHGYFDRDQYWSGADTWQAAEFFARNGYLTIAPDYRSWGGSDSGPSFFHMGLVADAINLISSLPSLPQADLQRIGLLGHSMGGGIATKVLVIDDRVSAAVLYAPNSADDADLIARWGPGCLPGQSEAAGDKCNPGEIIPPDLPDELEEAYLEGTTDPQFLSQVAPLFHLETVSVPLQIHSGAMDGASLLETPPQWSTKLYEALLTAGKEVAFFSYPDQVHYFQPAAWSQLVEHSLALFDDYLNP